MFSFNSYKRIAPALGLLLTGLVFEAQGQEPLTPPGGANLPAQPVKAADLLAISVYGAPELTGSVRVSPDGTIRLPMLSTPVEVAGMMPASIEDRIGAALAGSQILVDPVVTVNIAEYASYPISVVGAVGNPLTFETHEEITLLDALARAGGLSAEAGGDILITKREQGRPVLSRTVAVADLLSGAAPALEIVLQGGEEVRVPSVGRVFVLGNVTKPGAFPLGDTSGLSLLKALALAEGLAPFASKQAYIYRPNESGVKQEIEVELRQIMDRKQEDVTLQGDDILYIPDNSGKRLASGILDKIVSFAAGTASGALVLSVNR